MKCDAHKMIMTIHTDCDTLSIVYSVTVSNKTSKELWI